MQGAPHKSSLYKDVQLSDLKKMLTEDSIKRVRQRRQSMLYG